MYTVDHIIQHIRKIMGQEGFMKTTRGKVIDRKTVNNTRYTDNRTLMAETAEDSHWIIKGTKNCCNKHGLKG